MLRKLIDPKPADISLDQRAVELVAQQRTNIHRTVSYMFACLMLFQWAASIPLAIWLAPRTWSGLTSYTHPHVWAAIFLGGLIASLPAFMALRWPTAASTRHTIAAAQMLWSALLIHLTGGRIETHFHVFGSLAFLAFYRDWRVIVTATIVVALDHFVRGLWWPQSVFGVLTASPWRWLEHAGWVLFEDVFLFYSCLLSTREMQQIAVQRSRLERTNAIVEAQVQERTQQLRASEDRYRAIVEDGNELICRFLPDFTLTFANGAFRRCFSRPYELTDTSLLKLLPPESHQPLRLHLLSLTPSQQVGYRETKLDDAQGGERWLSWTDRAIFNQDGRLLEYQSFAWDSTAAKIAERQREGMHHQLVMASRRAGMVEVASSVLHNVGNVLNSVSVSAALIMQQLKQSRMENLNKTVDLIENNQHQLGRFLTTDQRGKQIPSYLRNLATNLSDEQERMAEEMGSMSKSIEHITHIVSAQQSYARLTAINETFDIAELIEESLRLNALSLDRHGVRVERRFPNASPITTDRHGVLQVLVNLTTNAKNAVREKNSDDKCITFTVKPAHLDGKPFIRLQVTDNGVGIAPENLDKLFSHGFTTRREGHGFGLHSAINTVRQLGGNLTADSPGLGRGATFTLDLPVDPPSQPASIVPTDSTTTQEAPVTTEV